MVTRLSRFFPARTFWPAILGILVLSCKDGTGPVVAAVVSVSVAPLTGNVPVGEDVSLTASVSTEGGAPRTVVWSSSNEDIATVDQFGNVTGHRLGPVAIAATSTFDASRKGQASLIVFQPNNTPSSVTIAAFRRSGSQQQVNLNAVAGELDVDLEVDPGQRRVSRVELRVDGVQVASREYSPPLPPSGGAGSTSVALTLSVNTATFNAQSGTVDFLNGPHQLVASVTTLGDVPGGSTAQALTFANVNTFTASVLTSGPIAVDGSSRTWTSGDLTVSVLPVIYATGGPAVQGVVIGYPGLSNKSATLGQTVVWSAQTSVAAGGSQDFSNNGGVNALAPFIVSSTLVGGGAGPSGAAANASVAAIRLDNRAPHPGVLTLASQSASEICCSGGWVGGAYLFNSGHNPPAADGEGVDGSGVGPSGVTYHVGAPALSNAAIAALPAVSGGSTLAESGFANAYTVVARVADRVGNVSLTRLAPSAANPSTVFGVDKSAPLFAFNEGGSIPDNAVNPSVLLFATQFADGLAGFAPSPVLHRIFRNFNSSNCILGGAGCAPVAGAGVISATVEEGFYFTYESFVRDQAGNASPVVSRTVLVDHQVPEVTAMPLPGSLVGGAMTQFTAALFDNVDLRSAQHRLDFATFDTPQQSLPFAPPLVLGQFGSPQVTTQSVFQAMNFVRSIKLTNSAGVPIAIVLPASASRFRVADEAGNVADRVAPFPGGAVPSGSVVAPTGLQTFRMVGPTLPTSVCSVQLCGLVPQSLTLSSEAVGPAGTFNNPFARVFFYWVDSNGTTQLIGSSVTPVAEESGGQRRWTWSIQFSPVGAPSQIGVQVFAIGVDSNGDGIRTPVNSNVIIVGPTL